MDVNLNIILHPNQQKIHSSSARFKVISAGKRFGKSKWATFAITKMAFSKPNGLFWYIAPTFGQAKDIAWSSLIYLIPPGLIKSSNKNELTITLLNDSIIQLKSADNPNSLRGPGIDGGVMDEAAYVDPYLWFAIIRGQLAGSLGPFYFISSPNSKGRNWFTDFYNEALRRQAAGESWAAWHFTIYDNPTLTAAEIADMKSGCRIDTWELEYMGIESEYAGQLYHEFHPVENVQAFEYDASLPLIRGLDWGISHPTVCLWAQYRESTKEVFIIDEFYKSGYVIEESCAQIKKMTRDRPIEWSVIDPSTGKRNSQNLRTDRDEFQRNGVLCFLGDNKDRGYDIVAMFLKKRLLKVHPRCVNLLSEFKNVQKGDKEGEDGLDATRYMMVRIHDLTFKGAVFNDAEKQSLIKPEELNLNHYMKKKESRNWVTEEIEELNAA